MDMLSMFCLFLFNRNLATILVQRGVLKKGTILLAGQSVARVNSSIKKNSFLKSNLIKIQVRALYNERGVQIERATLSMPVQVTGWKTLPAPGDEVYEVESEVKFENVIELNTIQVFI